MPQLDGLRAFAVVSVAISHWTPDFLAGIVPWGTGVQLFFVLSGFLITGILLRSRPADVGIGLWPALRVFYIRRVLRIFPIYYAVLAFSLLFSVGTIQSNWPWHVAYLSNFYYAHNPHGTAVADPFLHFWSLAVEEQFYLLWPLVALVLSRGTLSLILYGLIVGSVVFRLIIDHFIPSIVTVRYLTPSCFDAFAVGALIAHAKHYSGSDVVRRLSWVFAVVGISGVLLSVFLLSNAIGSEPARRIGHTFLVILYGAIVARSAEGFGGVAGRLLELRPILYLGKISYGIYVYHYFAPAAVNWFATRLGVQVVEQTPLTLAAYTVFTLILAVVSWHWYELPINRLKTRFEYPQGATRATRPGKLEPAVPGG